MGQKNTISSDICFPIEWADLAKKHFRIPIYQRKYAWQKEEVERLISDLKEWDMQKGHYFIGNIVVEKLPNNTYDVIDGQQRLTTLYLIASSMNIEQFTLDYVVRKNDNAFLKSLKEQKDIEINDLIEKYKPNNTFYDNYNTIQNIDQVEGILEKVKCSLTILSPDEIDIAKYFEVMNSRGKQLEKHQVLKAKFLEFMEEKDKNLYAKLWDYCSRMDTYIEDMIYRYEKRDKKGKTTISQECLRFELMKFASSDDKNLSKFFKEKNGTPGNDKISILDAIAHSDNTQEIEKEGVNRYRSLAKFEYFLLHVLNLVAPDRVMINDGQLIEQYNAYFKDYKNVENIKSFLDELFRYRLTYDYFFYKRDENTDKPFFAKISFQSDKTDNKMVATIDRDSSDDRMRRLLNLQLLFNFTTDFFAQDWLYTSLKWIDLKAFLDNPSVYYQKYIEFLEKLDRAAMLERLRENSDLKNLFYIFTQDCSIDIGPIKNLQDVLNKGTSTQHYWFYKLDYLLWRDTDWNHKFDYPFGQTESFKYSEIKQKYRLTRLNSIEHIKSQSLDVWGEDDTKSYKDNKKINCFGNLALISNHMNSSLSNESENKKFKIQQQLNKGTMESLKMILFYSGIKSSDDITLLKCKAHEEEMITILSKSIDEYTSQTE